MNSNGIGLLSTQPENHVSNPATTSGNQQLSQLSKLIGLIYDGATRPHLWTESILPAIAEYLQVPACILFTHQLAPQNGGYFFVHGIPQSHVDLYMNKYIPEDIWVTRFLEKGALFEGNVLIGEEFVPRTEFISSVIYKECFSLNPDIGQLLTSMVFGVENTSSLPTVFSCFRGFQLPEFLPQDADRLRLIVPHLSRSLAVMQRLNYAELKSSACLHSLDRLRSGIVLFDQRGNVTFANKAAQQIFKQKNGLGLRTSGNPQNSQTIFCEDRASHTSLLEALRITLDLDSSRTPHFSNSVVVRKTCEPGSYIFQFSALRQHMEFIDHQSEIAAIVFISDDAQDIHVDPIILQSGYGLTPAECRVAMALLESGTTSEVAKNLGTSLNTVNSQIKQIYAKLNVDTRARFVKLMMGLSSK